MSQNTIRNESGVSIPKVESLENEKFRRNEITSNFQSDFYIFDDLLKKKYIKSSQTERKLYVLLVHTLLKTSLFY